MYTYWKNHPAVFMTVTKKYIRILVGSKKHQYSTVIQELIENPNDQEMLSFQLSDIVNRHKLKGLSTFYSFSEHNLLLRTTSVPSNISSDEWKGHLYMELGESFHLPFQDPIIEIVGDRKVEERQDVIALAVPESDILEIDQLLTDAKLHPVAIDVPFLSLYRFFAENYSIEEDAHVLLLHIEYDVLQISMFHRHEPIYVRTLELPEIDKYEAFETTSGFQFLKVEKESLIMDEHFSIIQNEISRLRTFYQFNLQNGSDQINTMCITGEHPLIDKLITTYQNDEQLILHHSNKEFLVTIDGIGIPPSFTELIGLSWK